VRDKKNEDAKAKQMWQHYVNCPSKFKPLNKHSIRFHLFSQGQLLHDFLSIYSTALEKNVQVQKELMVRNNLLQGLVKKLSKKVTWGCKVTYNNITTLFFETASTQCSSVAQMYSDSQHIHYRFLNQC
jgi:hypothetical protein